MLKSRSKVVIHSLISLVFLNKQKVRIVGGELHRLGVTKNYQMYILSFNTPTIFDVVTSIYLVNWYFLIFDFVVVVRGICKQKVFTYHI